eukprot:3345806-Pyramimonas_sp.AAC.1
MNEFKPWLVWCKLVGQEDERHDSLDDVTCRVCTCYCYSRHTTARTPMMISCHKRVCNQARVWKGRRE